ncbi:30S ribosomal protein S9 [Candidatus Shikimatogenerans bostrichidophilus]|uniref:30S ribosomal protein S9 n=1 Tax=Candidatus Shikimatogenerans bostrichidophilus TaxID=2943807 RepID=UPI00296628A6
MIKYYHAKGKRKTSVALIYVNVKNNKTNKFIINNKDINIYFKNNKIIKYKILYPFILTKLINKYNNIIINVKGGGFTGQSEAIILAISRVICNINIKYKKILKKYNLLTRDSRIVERKKYGRKKSRKKFQFSKR